MILSIKKIVCCGAWVRMALLCLAFAGLAACSDHEDEYRERPVEDLYNDAMNHLDDGEYQDASKLFDEVERQHPYSGWATKAMLMSAYASYLRNRYDDALVTLDRFIQLHPGNRDAAYAYYLKGLCFYEQIVDVGRDQKLTEQALDGLQAVVDRFPTSKYARDARLKVDLTRDHLAGKEMNVGRFYQHRGLYLAALNRFKLVAAKYQTTTHAAEALHRQVEIYLDLGMVDDAAKVAAVLGYNFPGSDWYQDSYALLKKYHAPGLTPPKAETSGWLRWPW